MVASRLRTCGQATCSQSASSGCHCEVFSRMKETMRVFRTMCSPEYIFGQMDEVTESSCELCVLAHFLATGNALLNKSAPLECTLQELGKIRYRACPCACDHLQFNFSKPSSLRFQSEACHSHYCAVPPASCCCQRFLGLWPPVREHTSSRTLNGAFSFRTKAA